jgi:anti-sigma28 factor (negative regulator of flagellin synthesis)
MGVMYMKIQNIGSFMNYKGNSKPIKNEEQAKAKNYDVIEINGKSQRNSKASTLNNIKQKVVSQVNQETNAEKISRIKESLNNKDYKIDVEEIVNKLLK